VLWSWKLPGTHFLGVLFCSFPNDLADSCGAGTGSTLVFRCRRQAAARSGTHKRLGQPKTSDLFPARHRRQPLLLLLFRSCKVDGTHGKAVVNAEKCCDRGVDAQTTWGTPVSSRLNKSLEKIVAYRAAGTANFARSQIADHLLISRSPVRSRRVAPENPSRYGAKNPKISRTKCVGPDAKALTDPFVVGTIAMLDVIAPSNAFNVATPGCGAPCGHKVR
jgi:hypothetical protein